MSAYNDNNPLAQYPHDDDDGRMQYSHLSEFESRLDIQHHPASSSQIHPHPHPHPLFTCQENMNSNSNLNRSLDPQVITSHHSVYHSTSPFSNIQDQIPPQSQESSHGWPPYDPSIQHTYSHLNTRLNSSSYPSAGYSSPSPFAPVRPSPPGIHIPLNFKGQGHGPGLSFNTPSSSASHHRTTLAGSLDPSTGIFYRTPEHPRLRTAQACEKCRTRKAKCSGEHPSCKRCINRQLVCEYAKEGRVRGPNKPKPPKGGAATSPTTTKKHVANEPSSSTNASETSGQRQIHGSAGITSSKSRHRALSDHSSSGSSEHHPEHASSPIIIRGAPIYSETEEMAHSISPISPFPTSAMPTTVPGYRHINRDSSSLRSHRSSRPRLPDLHMDPSTELFQPSGLGDPRSATSEVSSDVGEMYRHPFHQHLQSTQPDATQSFNFDTSHMTYGSGASPGGALHQQSQQDLLSQTVQEFQRHYFPGSQRPTGLVPPPPSGHGDRQGMDMPSGVSHHGDVSSTSHHTQQHDLLDINHVPRELQGGPSEGDHFLYPSMSETYLHQQQQQQHGQQQQQQQQHRFLQRPFDSRSGGLDSGMGNNQDIKQEGIGSNPLGR